MGDIGVYILAGVIAAAVLVLLIVRFAMWLQSFLMELRYLNKEIERTSGEEKEHWIRRKNGCFYRGSPLSDIDRKCLSCYTVAA